MPLSTEEKGSGILIYFGTLKSPQRLSWHGVPTLVSERGWEEVGSCGYSHPCSWNPPLANPGSAPVYI